MFTRQRDKMRIRVLRATDRARSSGHSRWVGRAGLTPGAVCVLCQHSLPLMNGRDELGTSAHNSEIILSFPEKC